MQVLSSQLNSQGIKASTAAAGNTKALNTAMSVKKTASKTDMKLMSQLQHAVNAGVDRLWPDPANHVGRHHCKKQAGGEHPMLCLII